MYYYCAAGRWAPSIHNQILMDQQLRVRFLTSNPLYRISDAPFVIPARLGHKGLNQIINQLLALDSHIVFDFQITDHLLRTPLYKLIQSLRISTEDTIVIHYFVSTQAEESGQSTEQPAWIRCLDANLTPNHCISGCYDGVLRIFDKDNLEIVHELAAHEKAIQALTSWTYNDRRLLASAGNDQVVKLWALPVDSDISSFSANHLQANLCGHQSTVCSVSTWSRGLVSGDWSGNILAWDISDLTITGNEMQVDEDRKASKKRRTNSDKTIVTAKPSPKATFHIKAHNQAVSALQTYDNRCYSSSWDHSLKVWDLERQDTLVSINTSKVVTSLHSRMQNSLVATSHTDGRVKVWDERKIESPANVLGSSNTWIAQVFPLYVSISLYNYLCVLCVR
jgi:ribosome biogenesis protein